LVVSPSLETKIREDDGRERHTTTARELLVL
jgi:putative ribosome biogenesis GTPase RsgA